MTRLFTAAICLVSIYGCGSDDPDAQAAASTPAGLQTAVKQVTFTEADLDKIALGLRAEVDAVKAAQKKAAAAKTAQERGEAIQAQFESATMREGAKAAGLAEARYREIREKVDYVFTTLDFQGKIDGPMSVDLARSDAATKARVAGDAFADLSAPSAQALKAKMERLVPAWIEYKTLVAVGG